VCWARVQHLANQISISTAIKSGAAALCTLQVKNIQRELRRACKEKTRCIKSWRAWVGILALFVIVIWNYRENKNERIFDALSTTNLIFTALLSIAALGAYIEKFCWVWDWWSLLTSMTEADKSGLDGSLWLLLVLDNPSCQSKRASEMCCSLIKDSFKARRCAYQIFKV